MSDAENASRENGQPPDQQPNETPAAPDDRAADIGAISIEELIELLQAEVEAEKDARLRALAELQNFRRRSQEDMAQRFKYANEGLLADMIPILDNFELAMQAADVDDGARAVCKGYEMILAQLHDLARRYGLEQIQGEPGSFFDPDVHEAVEPVPTREPCEGTIVRVIRKGYRYHDRVLRPVQVAVAVSPDGAAPQQ